MRLSSLLSFLIQSSFAASVPSPLISCQCFRSCYTSLAGDSWSYHHPDDQYLCPPYVSLYGGRSIPRIQRPVKQSLTSTLLENDAILKPICSSAPGSTEQLVDTTAKHLVEDWEKNSQWDWPTAHENGDVRSFSWCEQTTQPSWKGARKYSERLEVGIVVVFFVALIIWEAIGRSGGAS